MIRLEEVQWLLRSPKLISASIFVFIFDFLQIIAKLRNGIFIIATDVNIQEYLKPSLQSVFEELQYLFHPLIREALLE
jgi:hypothetical protein